MSLAEADMRYTLHHCNAPHIATDLPNRAPIAQALYSAADDVYMTCNPTDYAVAAYHKGRIIGVFKYRIRGTQLRACGTAIAKKFRGKGIAQRLWLAAIRRWAPASIHVMVISDGGYNLVQAIRNECYGTGIRFHIVDDRCAA